MRCVKSSGRAAGLTASSAPFMAATYAEPSPKSVVRVTIATVGMLLVRATQVLAVAGVDLDDVADADERRDRHLQPGLGDRRLVLGGGRRPLQRRVGLD